MAEPETTLLVCLRVGDEGDTTVEGSAVWHCAICDVELWVAPSSQRFLAANGHIVVSCNDCAADLTPPDEPVEMRSVPGATSELPGAIIERGLVVAQLLHEVARLQRERGSGRPPPHGPEPQ
jgi:hypothetical protein